MGIVVSTISYAGIASENTATVIENKLIIKYCFNKGNVGSVSQKGGIVSHIYNNVGANEYDGAGEKPARGGKSNIDFSYNYNSGKVFTTTNNNIGGIIYYFCHLAYSNNCFINFNFSNNFNTASVTSGGSGARVGGVISWFATGGVGITSNNVNIAVSNCYNYSADIGGGGDSLRGGIVGGFDGNCSNVTLLNNYSAYKRGADSNVHGTTILGANVGE